MANRHFSPSVPLRTPATVMICFGRMFFNCVEEETVKKGANAQNN
jgi:hypothetical protein